MSQSVQEVFSFCPVESTDVGIIAAPNASYPIIVPFAKCVEWFRMVKKWQISVDVDFSFVGEGTITFTDNTVQLPDGRIGPLTSEHQFACWGPPDIQSTSNYFATGSWVHTFFGDEATISWSWRMFAYGTPTPPIRTDGIRVNAGDYYPQIEFNLGIAGDIDGTDFSTYDAPGGAPSYPGYLTIDGYGLEGFSTAIGKLLSITITPYEWWEYRPTSGGDPILNSATGAQINPNVVID